MSDQVRKTYEIGEKTYTQEKLKIGQVKQLVELLEGITFSNGLDPSSVVKALGTKLPRALAIVIKDEKVSLKNKDLGELEAELEFELDLEKSMEIITDFFDLTPISSLWNRLNMMLEKFNQKLGEITPKESGNLNT